MPPKRLKGIVKDVAFASAATAKASKRKASVLSASPHGLFDSADGKASNLPDVTEKISVQEELGMANNAEDLLICVEKDEDCLDVCMGSSQHLLEELLFDAL